MWKQWTIGALCLTALPAGARAQAPVGEYVVDAALSDDIRRAIDEATAEFNFIKRAIARKRLRATNPPTRFMSIKAFGDSIEVTSDSIYVVRSKPDGRAMAWRGFGDEVLQVVTMLEGSVLTTTFTAEDGVRTNRYHLRDDGLLELHVRLTSPQLKRAVEYRRVFRRV